MTYVSLTLRAPSATSESLTAPWEQSTRVNSAKISVALCAGFLGAQDRGREGACSAMNGRKEAEAGGKVIRSRCPTRGNSNFYEHLNDNTSS